MIIRRETLNALLPATTAHDTRYFLDAVQLEPAKHRAIATNGHVMLIATDTAPHADGDFPLVPGAEFHGDPAPIAVPADIIRSMIATMPKRSTLPILACAQLGRNGSDTTAIMSATDLEAPRTAKIAGDDRKFPQWERVIPNADRAVVRVALAVDVLEVLIKAAKAIAGTGRHAKAASITFDVPIGRRDRENLDTYDKDTDTHTKAKPGDVISAVGVTMIGSDVTVTGVAMPIRTGR